jgi:hypothetical protein
MFLSLIIQRGYAKSMLSNSHSRVYAIQMINSVLYKAVLSRPIHNGETSPIYKEREISDTKVSQQSYFYIHDLMYQQGGQFFRNGGCTPKMMEVRIGISQNHWDIYHILDLD